jgi:hypothetical protein
MKTLITALTLAILVIAPTLLASAHAGPRTERGNVAGETARGTYQGYPFSEWYRTDGW